MNANLIIVDDEVNIRRTLSKILAKQGYSVAVATDAAEALALARQQRFHLLISDLKLPDIDGLSLLREIRPLQPDSGFHPENRYSLRAPLPGHPQASEAPWGRYPRRLSRFRLLMPRAVRKELSTMPTLGIQELMVIFGIAVLLFGGRKIPELAKRLGKAFANSKTR
jgi:hypothetical protein